MRKTDTVLFDAIVIFDVPLFTNLTVSVEASWRMTDVDTIWFAEAETAATFIIVLVFTVPVIDKAIF